MASKAASEVSKTPTKKRKSGESHEAPSSSALVAVAATAYASLARGPLSANTEGARKLAAYVGDGVATCVQALVDGGVGSTRLVMRSVRNTERVYKNATADEVAAEVVKAGQDNNHLQKVVNVHESAFTWVRRYKTSNSASEKRRLRDLLLPGTSAVFTAIPSSPRMRVPHEASMNGPLIDSWTVRAFPRSRPAPTESGANGRVPTLGRVDGRPVRRHLLADQAARPVEVQEHPRHAATLDVVVVGSIRERPGARCPA